jgi:putative transposase
VYHVMNRAVGRAKLFERPEDYAAFLRAVDYANAVTATRVLSYCVMPNHWHFVIWPEEDGELSTFMRILTVTHTQRWHAMRKSAGTGPVYQGRFKSFPVQMDGHVLEVCRYVERNALRAGLVPRSVDWTWGSASARSVGDKRPWLLGTSDWPVEVPRDWSQRVDEPQSPEEEEALRLSITRGRPFGDPRWTASTATRFGLSSTLTPRGRPRLDTRP